MTNIYESLSSLPSSLEFASNQHAKKTEKGDARRPVQKGRTNHPEHRQSNNSNNHSRLPGRRR